MLFYELTWSPISQPAKDAIAFDSTAVYAHRRASVNNVFKQFVNDVAPDPLVYTGTGRERIQATIGQALCWALSADWQGLPDEQQICTPDTPGFASRLDADEFAFITHSLGSRITTDGLQRLTRYVEMAGPDRPEVRRVSQSFQERDVKIFMLANQLPLLQSGLEPASVQGAVPAYLPARGRRLRRPSVQGDRADRVQRSERPSRATRSRMPSCGTTSIRACARSRSTSRSTSPGSAPCSASASSPIRSPRKSTTTTTSG